MGEVPTYADTLFMSFRRSPVISGMVMSEHYAVVNVLTYRLRSRPLIVASTGLCSAENRAMIGRDGLKRNPKARPYDYGGGQSRSQDADGPIGIGNCLVGSIKEEISHALIDVDRLIHRVE